MQAGTFQQQLSFMNWAKPVELCSEEEWHQIKHPYQSYTFHRAEPKARLSSYAQRSLIQLGIELCFKIKQEMKPTNVSMKFSIWTNCQTTRFYFALEFHHHLYHRLWLEEHAGSFPKMVHVASDRVGTKRNIFLRRSQKNWLLVAIVQAQDPSIN